MKQDNEFKPLNLILLSTSVLLLLAVCYKINRDKNQAKITVKYEAADTIADTVIYPLHSKIER